MRRYSGTSAVSNDLCEKWLQGALSSANVAENNSRSHPVMLPFASAMLNLIVYDTLIPRADAHGQQRRSGECGRVRAWPAC